MNPKRRSLFYFWGFQVFLFLSFVAVGCKNKKQNVVKTQKEAKKVVLEAFQRLSTRLQASIRKKGIPVSIAFCSQNAHPLLSSLEKKYKVEIRRVSNKPRNPKNAMDNKEQRQFTALFAGKKPSSFEMAEASKHFYYFPIFVNKTLCLNCHGKPKQDIQKETWKAIVSQYPKDQAIGYSLGDWRGFWKIAVEK